MKKIRNNQTFLRKFIASAIILLLLYTTCGYIIIFQHLILLNRQLINLSIEKNDIDFQTVLLSFKKSDIQEKLLDFTWERTNEFRFKGEIFDIVQFHETSDRIFYECVHDKMERNLEAGFIKHFEGEDEKRNQNALPNSALKIEFPDFFFNNDFLYSGGYQHQKFVICFKVNYVSLAQQVPSPPPRILS